MQEALEKNGYPATFVQRLRLPQPKRDEEQPARTSVTIPYIHGLSQTIRRVLSHLDIKVAFCPFQTLRQELVHPKDPVPEWQRKGVVYTIPCDQCPRCYVGQTGRCLEQRLAEHRRALKKGPPDGLVQGQGNGFPPSHPDTVFIGVLAHPTRTGPSQQREGHTARTLHPCADVTMASNLYRLCMLQPPHY